MGYNQSSKLILCDNQCAVGMASNSVEAKRTKSIDMRCHRIRDRVQQGHFHVQWRKGEHNLADFFTKPNRLKHIRNLCHSLYTRNTLQSQDFKNQLLDGQLCGLAHRTKAQLRGCVGKTRLVRTTCGMWRNNPLFSVKTKTRIAARQTQ
jgi:hypothetical protein